VAQRVAEFQSKTPPRFRVAPRGAGSGRRASVAAPGGSSGWQAQQPQITDAKEPLLRTAARLRPRRFKTREEEEEEEVERARAEAAAIKAAAAAGMHM
jgi:hypothetical protein